MTEMPTMNGRVHGSCRVNTMVVWLVWTLTPNVKQGGLVAAVATLKEGSEEQPLDLTANDEDGSSGSEHESFSSTAARGGKRQALQLLGGSNKKPRTSGYF